jgi:chaperonin GroEL (HSP60 family)
MMALPDGALSRVVLIGVSRSTDPGLGPLPSVVNNLDALQQTLTHQDWWGIPGEQCVRIDDQDEPLTAQDIRDALGVAAGLAEDLFLVYYAGHGISPYPGDLVLAATDTVQSAPRGHGVSIDEIRDAFITSRARTRILILDCCYSGMALEHMGLDKATATLASVPATEVGTAPEHDEFTTFGGHLVRVLRHGIAGKGRPSLLTLRMIADEIRALAREPRLARLQASQGAEDVPLIRNPAKRSGRQVALTARVFEQLADVVRGVDEVAVPICRTFGPRGLATRIPVDGDKPSAPDDTATIARSFRPRRLSDEIGVAYIRDRVQSVHRQIGDGGTATVVLARSLVDGLFDALRRGANSGELIDGVERGFSWATDELADRAKPVESRQDLMDVTRTSARNVTLSKIAADAVNLADPDGAVLVENSHAFTSSFDLVPGLCIDGGCIGWELYTDQVRGEAVLDEPQMVVEPELSMAAVLLATTDPTVIGGRKSLAIFTAKADGDAVVAAADAKTRSGLDLVVIKVGKSDIEMLTQLMGRIKPHRDTRRRGDAGPRLPRRIVATRERTVIVWAWDNGNDPVVPHRVPIVRVGAEAPADLRLAEAAVSAALAARDQGGTVAGGGMVLLAAHRRLRRLIGQPTTERPLPLRVDGDRLIGLQIAADALAAPARQIWQNARLDVEQTLADLPDTDGVGIDIQDGTTGDMVEKGIVDPVAVVRVAMAEALATAEWFVRLA